MVSPGLFPEPFNYESQKLVNAVNTLEGANLPTKKDMKPCKNVFLD